MIQFGNTATLATRGRAVPQNPRDFLNVTDALRLEAAAVLKGLFDGASWKRVQSAAVPGAGPEYLSRAKHGCDSNPLYRVAALLLLMKRLGMGRAGALKLLGWMHELVDWIWPPEETAPLDELLERDSERDVRDDHLRYMTAKGCPIARAKLIEEKRNQLAELPEMILALQEQG